MNEKNRVVDILATDLDGTWIPLKDHVENEKDLKRINDLLCQRAMPLVYVTGRHFESVCAAIDEFQLPIPTTIICDVGASILHRTEDADHLSFLPSEDYRKHLSRLTNGIGHDDLLAAIRPNSVLRAQEDEKQSEFKLSFYAEGTQLNEATTHVQESLESIGARHNVISSIDPFNGDGLIDILPSDCSKASALAWWAQHHNFDSKQILFAGDSGNDWSAFIAGYRTIVVGNADRAIAERVRREHFDQGLKGRLHLAKAFATSGVWEGLHHFLGESRRE